ncbi:hypothetical protein ACFW1J_28495 [Priestia aryabhattai]|uniref:hypothetical protein n=1 Tax=Priestia aryabhattai TaxID=412384 RepID=UPI00356973CC
MKKDEKQMLDDKWIEKFNAKYPDKKLDRATLRKYLLDETIKDNYEALKRLSET